MTSAAGSEWRTPGAPMQHLGNGLYAFSVQGPVWLYVLFKTPPSETQQSLSQFWQIPGAGWGLFLPVAPDALPIDTFTARAREHLVSVDPNVGSAFVWMADIDDVDSQRTMHWIAIEPTEGVGGSTATFDCGRISLTFVNDDGGLQYTLDAGSHGAPTVLSLVWDTSNVALRIDGERQHPGFPLNPFNPGSTAWCCQIAFDGPQSGSLAMPLALDLGTLTAQLGLSTRYQYDPALLVGADTTDSQLATLHMPLFSPQAPSSTPDDFSAFNLLLNPLRPWAAEAAGIRVDRFGRILSGARDDGQSVQSQQLANARALVSRYSVAADGAPVTLTPADPLESGHAFDAWIGGGFAWSPDTDATDTAAPPSPALTMCPAGQFTPNRHHGPHAHTTGVDLMPGLFSLDFIRLAAGDRLSFEPGHPAGLAPPAAPAPNSTMTTAWLSVVKGDEADGRGYFSQSCTASLFLPDQADTSGLLSPTLAQLSPLHTTPAFPMLFMPALFASNAAGQPINPWLDATLVSQLDRKIIGPHRHRALLDAPDGPLVQLPSTANTRLATAADTRPVITPQGYIVEVDASGIFTDITLGVGNGSTVTPNALRFRGSGTPRRVAPPLSTLLTRENLFLVASREGADWNFDNHIAVAGFEFVVALLSADDIADTASTASTSDSPLLIIKLDPRRTLREMALDATAWTDGGRWVGGNTRIQPTLNQLSALFDEAEQPVDSTAEDPFRAFRALLDSPGWTGVIAFDARVDGNGMPPDLQMLLGGIPGPLQAHHIGIETSKVTDDRVAQSSVFGVINYHRDDSHPPASPVVHSAPPAPGYDVKELVVQIGNSTIIQLHASVELMLYQLLGRDVWLEGSDENRLEIKGRYQKHGEVGRLTFTTDTPFIYTPVIVNEGTVRVIDSIHITHASLVPAAADDTPADGHDTTSVASHFTLDGQLFFNADPFPGAGGLDLFSYGLNGDASHGHPQGLEFSGLTVAVDFQLDSDGSMVPGSKSVVLNDASLTPRATPSAVRPQSLLGSLPLQLTTFEIADTASGSTVGNGARPVNVLELVSPAGTRDSDTRQATTAAFTTATPVYGLSYTLSLGSLGALSDVHAGLSATLTIGWGPSPTIPENDAAAILVALPSLSAGYQGFDLQGFVSTRFDTANLLKVVLDDDRNVYAMSFDNVQLSVLGYALPPGVLVDFMLFSGNAADARTRVTDASSIGWVLSATTDTPEEATE